MSDKEKGAKFVKKFRPEGGTLRNYLNVLENLLALEIHYVEFAEMNREGLNTECCQKHLLIADNDLYETVLKATRARMDCNELMDSQVLISKLLGSQINHMYGREPASNANMREYYQEKADATRFVRQKLMSAIKWDEPKKEKQK